MSIIHINSNESIGDSLSSINLNFSYLEENFTEINNSISKLEDILDVYLTNKLDIYTNITNNISQNKFIWDQARTLVAANSAVWLQPLVFLYPCIVQQAQFILTKEITNTVVGWLNEHFPVISSAGDVNYIENQAAFVGIMFRKINKQNAFEDNTINNHIITLKCVVRDCKWVADNIMSSPFKPTSETIFITKTPVPTPYPTETLVSRALPVINYNTRTIYYRKSIKNEEQWIDSIRDKIDSAIVGGFDSLYQEFDGSYTFTIEAYQCIVEISDSKNNFYQVLNTGDNNTKTATISVYTSAYLRNKSKKDIRISVKDSKWGEHYVKITARIKNNVPLLTPTPTSAQQDKFFSMKLVSITSDNYDSLTDTHTGTIQAIFDSPLGGEFIITLKNSKNELLTDFIGNKTLWSLSNLSNDTYSIEVVNYNPNNPVKTRILGELYIADLSDVSSLKIKNSPLLPDNIVNSF